MYFNAILEECLLPPPGQGTRPDAAARRRHVAREHVRRRWVARGWASPAGARLGLRLHREFSILLRMSTRTGGVVAPFHFEAEQLLPLADQHRDGYLSAQPFQHIVFDDFLPASVLDEVLGEFPSPQREEWKSFDGVRERKLATKDDSLLGDATRHLLAEFNSAAFIDFLQRLTAIDGLVPDPHFEGGGLHQIERGGHLSIHADFNRHPHTRLLRRLNVIVYLNRDWEDDFGGALELWSRDMRSCDKKVLPVFNRCVIFSTTDTAFHGHPEPLNCPDGWTRKSMALYYYSAPDGGGVERPHNTLFRTRPGEAKPLRAWTRDYARERAKELAWLVTPPILLDVARAARQRRAARP